MFWLKISKTLFHTKHSLTRFMVVKKILEHRETAALVVCGLTGAVTQVKSPFGVFLHYVTDRWTNRPTNLSNE